MPKIKMAAMTSVVMMGRLMKRSEMLTVRLRSGCRWPFGVPGGAACTITFAFGATRSWPFTITCSPAFNPSEINVRFWYAPSVFTGRASAVLSVLTT